jgi:hypothetical protein
MATLLWICDYCEFTDESEEQVNLHEKKCDNNPDNQQEDLIDLDDSEDN